MFRETDKVSQILTTHNMKTRRSAIAEGSHNAPLVGSCYVSRGMGVGFQTTIVTFKTIQGHWRWHHSTGQIRFPLSLPLPLSLYLSPFSKHCHISQNLNRSS